MTAPSVHGRCPWRPSPRSIEPVFVMEASHHEHLFDVKGFFERVFAFRSPGG